MEYKDYYKILGVDKSASQDDIKKKYRKLAREHHPDVNPNNPQAEAKFKDISEAYEVLGNAENRKKYDQLGANWKQQQQAHSGQGDGFDFDSWARAQGAGSSRGGFDFGGEGGDFSDFFGSFFGGGGGGHSRRRRGQDVQARMSMPLKDAYRGGPTTIHVGNQTLRLNLKPGIEDGQTIRLKGKGQPGGQGAEPGDLYITFEVTPDPEFTRKGNDLYADLPVPLYTLLLGGPVEVPTLTGTVKVTVKPETPNGHVIRLRGKGMPVYGKENQHGDLYVKLLAELPKQLKPEEIELIRQLATHRK